MDSVTLNKSVRESEYPVELRQQQFRKSLSFYNNFIKELKHRQKSRQFPSFLSNLNSIKLTPSQAENIRIVKDYLSRTKSERGQLLYGCIAPGGCGKSVLLKRITGLLEERQLEHAVVSYTAVSAMHCNGCTIHSFLNLPYAASGGNEWLASIPASKKFIAKCRNLEFLLIDEIGLLNCEFLNLINKRLQKARKNNEDFGGVNVLIFGDFHQLPPVFPPELYTDKLDIKPFSKEGQILFKKFQLHQLRENVRASKDNAFQSFCTRVRERNLSSSDVNLLRERQMNNLPEAERSEFHNALHIFPRHASVDAFNFMKLNQMGNPIVKVIPKQKMGSPPLPPEETLYLCDNAPVVLSKNLSFKYGLLNGSKGRVHAIYYKRGNYPSNAIPSVVFVKFDKYSGPSCESGEEVIVPICPMCDSYYDKSSKSTRTIKKIPLRLGFASTVHGVQSQTLEKYVIHFDSREYFLGQTYVCLSRGTSFKSFAVFDDNLVNSRCFSPFISCQYQKFEQQLLKIGIIPSNSRGLKRKH